MRPGWGWAPNDQKTGVEKIMSEFMSLYHEAGCLCEKPLRAGIYVNKFLGDIINEALLIRIRANNTEKSEIYPPDYTAEGKK